MAYSPEQQRNFRLALGLTRGTSPKLRRALLMAMLVESSARHLNYGHLDSMGILQQRPSMGWGPYIPGRRGVVTDMRQFLRPAMQLIRQGFRGGPGQLAQAVQRSAFPSRYGERRGEVNTIIRNFRGQGARAGGGGGGGGARAGGGPDLTALLSLLQGTQLSAPPELSFTRPREVLAGLSPGSPESQSPMFGGRVGLTPGGMTTAQLEDQLAQLRRSLYA